MENCQLILNSNSLCVICLSEVEVKESNNDLFPLHHLTSKINSNLGNVFKDVTVPWAPHAVMDRLEILADVCEGCVDLCEELLYKFQDDVEMETCVKTLLDKMEKVGLEDKYKSCGSPVAVFYLGIVDRLRKEIMQKLRWKLEVGEIPNSSETGAATLPQKVPDLFNIPDVPLSQICSYLYYKDIISCSTVNKDLRRLVFPSLINSSFITFENRSQIPAMIDFIKIISNNLNKVIDLLIKCESLDDSPDSRTALLHLLQECGPHIRHLKFSYAYGSYHSDDEQEVVNCFRDNNSIPVRAGKELFPSMKRLDIVYNDERQATSDSDISSDEDEDEDKDEEEGLDMAYRENQIKASLPFVKAVFENSPALKELTLDFFNCLLEEQFTTTHLLFKLIGESGFGLRLDTLEARQPYITDECLAYLHALDLKRLVLDGEFALKESQALTNFLESQSHSLKHLELVSNQSQTSVPHFTFPLMESLETYTLNISDRKNDEGLGPVSYQTQLPKLKEIELKAYRDKEHINEQFANEDYFRSLFPFDAKYSSVKELRLLSMENLEKCNLMMAVCAFEFLTRLEIPTVSYLSDCWEHLVGLEELTLHPSCTLPNSMTEEIEWIDKIITGLNFYRDFHRYISGEVFRMFERQYEEMKPKKSLALLKRLRLLRLRHYVSYDDCSRLKISDISCRLVLMKMESLKCIDFRWFHHTRVGPSEKVLCEMRKRGIHLIFGDSRD